MHFATLTTIGVAIEVGASLGLTPLLSSLLYNVKPLDAVAMIGTIILFFICSLLAALLPVRRAASVDPMQALRTELKAPISAEGGKARSLE